MPIFGRPAIARIPAARSARRREAGVAGSSGDRLPSAASAPSSFAAAHLAPAQAGQADEGAGVDFDDDAARAGSGSIGQTGTLPSSAWSSRMPAKLALATWAAPIAS